MGICHGTMVAVPRSNYPHPAIELPPGRYRVYGFPPMTGLLLNKWIEVQATNEPGCYGEGNFYIAEAIPNLLRIESESGELVWQSAAGDRKAT